MSLNCKNKLNGHEIVDRAIAMLKEKKICWYHHVKDGQFAEVTWNDDKETCDVYFWVEPKRAVIVRRVKSIRED